MSHGVCFASTGWVCALAAFGVIAAPLCAQSRQDPANAQDLLLKPDAVQAPDSVKRPASAPKPASAEKPDFARYLARPDGSMPMVLDWSNRHVIYTAGYTDEQAERMARDPRAYAAFVAHGMASRHHDPIGPAKPFDPGRPLSISVPSPLHRDWAVSLGSGEVYPLASPAKYVFDVNAAPSCTNDFVVFPAAGSPSPGEPFTGSTRANVVGTFADDPTSGQTTSITITPTNSSSVTMTLTAGSMNSGTTFAISGSNDTTTDAANLAAAINRNLSSVALDEIAAVPSSGTVTVYALTAGTGETLSDASGLSNFSWGTATSGTNGNQANIVGLNNLYTGSSDTSCPEGSPSYTYPTFTFSYAAGRGQVYASPIISLDGTKIAFVESDNSDPSIGTILHVLTLGTGTEFGTCTNNGTDAPTCATAAVIPGSTSGSYATDYMLPLELAAGQAPADDFYSSPFIDYSNDILYVSDVHQLYSVSPVFGAGAPALRVGFPVTISEYVLSSPVEDAGGTGNIFFGDSDGNLYSVTSGGTIEGSIAVGSGTAAGIEEGPIVDSTNGVGYAVVACNGTDSVLFQFSTGANSAFGALATTDLSSAGCASPYPLLRDPAPDNNYYTKGISSGTPGDNGELLAAYGNSTNSDLVQFQFTSGVMNTTAQYTDTDGGPSGTNSGIFAANLGFTPLTEFYGDDLGFAITAITQSGNTVTVSSGAFFFVPSQVAVISGVTAGTGDCTSAATSAIDGEQTVTANSGGTFTFTSPVSTMIGGANGTCTLTGAVATGPTQDYLFFGTSQPEVYTFDLPLTGASQTAAATNTTSVSGGASGIIVDNDSSDGQASSIYFSTLDEALSICSEFELAFCAVKLTQAGLN